MTMSDSCGRHTHVDDFIDDYKLPAYPRWFFMLARLPANLHTDFQKYIEQYKLFCTWNCRRWRVTGASRMGDVWLVADFKKDHGHDERVLINECTDWSDKP